MSDSSAASECLQKLLNAHCF